MAIETTCEGCGARLSVDGNHAGRSAQCPQCGHIYVVPQPERQSGSAEPAASPSPADSVPMTGLWHLKTPEGRTYGPVDRSTLDQWTSEGRVSCDCLLRTDGDWLPADEVYPELKPPPAEQGNPFARGQSPIVNTAFQEPHRGPLILVLGIVGFLVTCPVLSGMAWFMGNSDLRKMQLGRMDPSGYSLTQVGRIFGMILSLFWLVSLGIFFLVFVSLIAMNA